MEFEMRTKAFSNESKRVYRISVSENNVVKVWDDHFKYFTRCHIMTDGAMSYARKKARKIKKQKEVENEA